MNPPPLPSRRPAPPGIWVHALIGAVVVGGIAFAIGFFGPMFWLKHNSPQGPMLGIFVTGPAGFVIGLIGGTIVGFARRGKDAVTPALAAFIGMLAVLACGIPFVPPLAMVAIPLAVVSLSITSRSACRRAPWTPGRVIGLAVSILPAVFACYLAFGRHHLIDWLEGH